MAEPKRYEMSWVEVDVSKVKTAFKTADIGALDAAKLRVMASLLKKTLSATVQTAIYTYIARNWEESLQRLEVESKLLGISPETLFNTIVNDLPMPDR